MKLYAYENSNGDKGVIIADNIEKAAELFKEKYPGRKIADNDNDYDNGGAYLFESGDVENNKLFCTFPW